MYKQNKVFVFSFVLLFSVLGARLASAGFIDKLNAATKKLENATQTMNQRTQQMEQAAPKGNAQKFEKTKTSNPITGEWGNQVTCAGPNSATCQNGMDNLVNCNHQAKGYFYRLVAANLEEKSRDPDWSAEDLKILKEDIRSVKDAIKTDKVVDPDPEEPQRYMTFLSEEDQQEIQRLNIKYINEVRKDCDERFGGMSQFSN